MRGLNPKRVTLDNGVTVIAKSNHTTPAVSIAHRRARPAPIADPPDRDGTAALCARVLDRGTVTRSADAIADDLDGRGASLSVDGRPSPDGDRRDLPDRRFCRGAGAGGRRGAASAVCRRGNRDAARQPDHLDPPGGRRSGVDGGRCVREGALRHASLRAKSARHDRGHRGDPPPGPRPLSPEGLRPVGHHRRRRRRHRRRGGHRRGRRSCSATGPPPPSRGGQGRRDRARCAARSPSASWCRCR